MDKINVLGTVMDAVDPPYTYIYVHMRHYMTRIKCNRLMEAQGSRTHYACALFIIFICEKLCAKYTKKKYNRTGIIVKVLLKIMCTGNGNFI